MSISALFIATTAKNDKVLLKEVRALSEKRVQEGKFAVGLLFWDDIYSGVALDPTVLSSHYPGLMISAGTTSGSGSSDRLSGLVLGC